MENEFLRLEKQILQEHYERFLKAHYSRQFMHLRFLVEYIHNTTFFKEVCKTIMNKSANQFGQAVYQIVHTKEQAFLPNDYRERSHLAYLVVEAVVRQNNASFLSNSVTKYMKDQQGGINDHYITFNELFVEPCIAYLLNQSDKNFVLFRLLSQYKHRTEWFNRDRLNELANKDESVKEHRLVGDLYSYLFDRGMEFFIQPSSPAGEVDFLAAQKGSLHKLLIEGKVFDGRGRHKQHIIDGFRQIMHYAADYHEHTSYLVVFNVTDKSLVFPGGTTSEGLVELSRNSMIVYVLIIDICIHGKTASKRMLGEIVQFSQEDFQ